MTREDTNRTNDQSKASTGKSIKLNVSDLTPKTDPKGGDGIAAIRSEQLNNKYPENMRH